MFVFALSLAVTLQCLVLQELHTTSGSCVLRGVIYRSFFWCQGPFFTGHIIHIAVSR